MTKYIPHTPTTKQAAFLLLDCLDAFYGGAASGGKASSVDSIVCTPYGTRRIGDIKEGERICNPEGGNSKVIKIYEQGIKQLYRFTFSDGSTTKVTEDHLWKYSISGRGKWRKSGLCWKLATTSQLIRRMKDGRRILIPLCKPVQFTRSYRYDYREIHPYLLGVLLGIDGHIGNSMVKFSKPDREIFDRINEVSFYDWGEYECRDKNSFTWSMRGEGRKEVIYWLEKLGLYGKRSWEKFIPEQYKYSTIDSRFELLRGLMDTDGYCSSDGKAFYTSVSEQLAKDVQWLVRSLGGNATITSKIPTYTYMDEKRTGREAHTIYIRMPDNAIIFYLPRKKELANKYNAGGMELKKRLVSIEKCELGEAKCIKVDNPNGLYITDDFIVTHNSEALLMAALQYIDIPGYNALLMRDTYQNLIKPEALMDRAHEWLHNTDAHWDGSKRCWVFPSSATLSFGHLENPKDHFNYDSAAYHFIGIDEVVNIRENQLVYMFSRLRKLKKLVGVPLRFRCASNPPRREQMERGEYIKRRYVDLATRGNRVFIPAWIEDNPYADEESYRRSLSQLDSITRMQLEEGNWEVRVKGNLFDRSDFTIIDRAPADVVQWVRYWDLAATEVSDENKNPARSAGCKMGLTRDHKIYIADIVKFQKNPPGTERMVKQTAKMDGIEVEIFMEQEPGSGGKNTISHYRRNVLLGYAFSGNTVSGRGDKVTRANPLSTQVEAHNVYLVNGPWIKDFLDEVELFPYSKFKDQVDSASGAYQMLAGPATKCRLTFV